MHSTVLVRKLYEKLPQEVDARSDRVDVADKIDIFLRCGCKSIARHYITCIGNNFAMSQYHAWGSIFMCTKVNTKVRGNTQSKMPNL